MSTKKIFLAAILFPLWGLGGLHAQSITASGYCGANAGGGTNLTWTLYSDSTLTINGSGAMDDFYNGFTGNDNAPWKSYRSQIKTVIIGDSVNNIGVYAFLNCGNLTFVSMENSITDIAYAAFANSAITIPNSVITIGGGAFYNCINLASITIPNSVTHIGHDAFDNCKSLISATIGNNVTTIEDYAFRNCTNLSSLIIHAATPPTFTSIFSSAPFGGAFDSVPNAIPVYVPCTSVHAYQIAWNYFSNFIGFTNDTTFFYDTICLNTVYNGNGFNISEGAGVYYRAEKTAQNCDSIICLNLFVAPYDTLSIFDTICQDEIYNKNGFYESTSGTYYNILQNIYGCDSVVILNLYVASKDTIFILDTICEGEIYQENGFNEYVSGTYTQNLQNRFGCDSLVFLTLYVASKDTIFIFDTICNGDIYQENGFNEHVSGTYIQNLKNIYGCDSLVILNLTITSVGIVDFTDSNLEITSYEIYDIMGRNLTSSLRGMQCRSNPEKQTNIMDCFANARNDGSLLAPSLLERAGGEVLPAGMYILRLHTNQGIITKKIIKSN